jgi:hypothetical protein
LIYFSLNEKCFSIKFVDNKPVFYPLGTLPSYKVTCELFEYSSERFMTGIPGIDALNRYSEDSLLDAVLDTNNNIIVDTNYVVITNTTD